MEGRTFKHASINQRDKLDSETTRSEWGGLFREDISQSFPFELVQGCIVPGHVELPRGGVTYRSFDDPMGGRGDSWAKAIAHRDDDED